tara:strand:- start:1073 stop:1732 length:660 start_codon:yes stop_codon:yes gene_type:complete
MKFNIKKITMTQRLVFIAILAINFFCSSCKELPDASISTESKLIMKINAVQEQIMAQGNVTEVEEQALLSLCNIISQNDGMAVYTSENSKLLKDVEKTPIYNGCMELSKEEIRECFNKKISAFIKQEFNLNISKDLNLMESKQVEAFFIIDKNGKLTGMKVRDSELTIQAEILRVLRKIPTMKPASHHGVNVAVLCSMIVSYGDEIEAKMIYIPERPNE